MNGYICMYKGQKVEIQAATTYEAQQKAFEQLSKKHKRIKQYQIDVYLCEREDGSQVVHTPN